MRKSVTGAIIALYLVAIIVTGLFALINSGSSTLVRSYDYVIDNYSVVANVNKDNTIAINETITASFRDFRTKHGIFRTLPLTSSVGETDSEGNVSYKNYRYSYSDIYCNINYEVYTQSGTLVIQIGNAYENVSGETITYNISYTINLGNDRDSSKDTFYYNLIGSFWDTEILSADITVILPEAVSDVTPVVYYGGYGETNLGENFTFDGKTLNYTHTSTLDMGEGITVRMELEEGYFSPVTSHVWDIINLILILAVAGISLVIFMKKSCKSPLTPVVQFELSDGTSSADVGYLIDRYVHDKDIASLVILWAQKGFLKIKEENKTTTLIKVKDADKSLKLYERVLFDKIFEKGNEVNLKSLGANLSATIQTVMQEIELENKGAFNKSAITFREIIAIITSVVFTSVLFKIAYTAVSTLFTILSFVGGALCYLLLKSLMANLDEVVNKKRKWISILLIILLVGFIVCEFIFCYDFYLDSFGNLIISFGLILLNCIIVRKFNVRTEEGMKKLGDIIGLKTFIEVTEKDRLEMLAKDNPEIFYNVLPYAYVFGIYETWCKKFEDIVIKMPDWYTSDTNVLDFIVITSLLRSTMINFSSTLQIANFAKRASLIKSVGSIAGHIGGFGGGGGFSGGGHGGGGGGSW